jgi:hypothetical protein
MIVKEYASHSVTEGVKYINREEDEVMKVFVPPNYPIIR